MTLVAVAVGGAFGACLRAVLMAGIATSIGRYFTHGLAVANTLGSFLLGVFVALVDPAYHPLLVTGLCGALTTFSTFAHSGVELLREGRIATWAFHVALNFGGSLAGVAVGLSMS